MTAFIMLCGFALLIIATATIVTTQINHRPRQPKPKKLTRHERALQRIAELEAENRALDRLIDKEKP